MIYIPKKIKAGYNEREDTFSKKLAFVIYYDEKNVLRKEKSWNSWRNQSIQAEDFENEPIEGFVLNKKAGGGRYGWNPRQTYCRVYDPRGFEIEITIPNLLYILENCNCIKGKGLEGKFVYGWDGTELILIPESAPEFEALVLAANERMAAKKISKKDLKIGQGYLTREMETIFYLGDFYEDNYYSREESLPKLRKTRLFWNKNENIFLKEQTIDKLKLLRETDDNLKEELPNKIDEAFNEKKITKRDKTKDKIIEYKIEDLLFLNNLAKKKGYYHWYEHFTVCNENWVMLSLYKNFDDNTITLTDDKYPHSFEIKRMKVEELMKERKIYYWETFDSEGNLINTNKIKEKGLEDE